MRLPKISLHPKFAAVIDAVINGLFLWWLTAINTPRILLVWWLARLLIWVLEIAVVYFPPVLKRWRHLVTVALFQTGLMLLAIFIDWRFSWIVGGTIMVMVPAVSFWLLPLEANVLSFNIKPYRRWRFIMTIISVAGIWVGLSAATLFQIFSPFPWWLSLVGAALTSLIAGWWWWEYDVPVTKRLFAVLGVLFVVCSEIALLFFWWPVGYLVIGVLLTWWWYILWLMGRFYLSTEGIHFQKQRSFLITNAILMVIYLLFVVRWR